MPDQDLKEALKAALDQDIPAPEVAAPEKEEPAEDVETASDSDIVTDKEPAEEKEPDPVPYGRFKEKVDEANLSKAEVTELRSQVSALTSTLTALQKGGLNKQETKEAKAEAKETLETLVSSGKMTREDADNFITALNAAGVARGETANKEEVTSLRKELDDMKKIVLGDKDQQNLKSAVAQFDGIVTEKQVKDKLQEMVRSSDPDRMYAANNFSYEKIIMLEFAKEIYSAEADKVLAAKKKPAPKVETKGGKEGPKKPDAEDLEYDPSNPRGFSQSLKSSMKQQMRSSE